MSSGLLSVLNGAGRGPLLLNTHPYPAGHSAGVCVRVCACVLLSVTCALKSYLRVGQRGKKKPEASRLDLDSGVMFPLRSLTCPEKTTALPLLSCLMGEVLWRQQLNKTLGQVWRALYLLAAEGHASLLHPGQEGIRPTICHPEFVTHFPADTIGINILSFVLLIIRLKLKEIN